jgi:hypothetical protein
VTITSHAYERAFGRIRAAGGNPDKVLQAAELLARTYRAPTAVRLLTLPEQVGTPWGEESNGDQVWAICRDSRVVTLMLRRSTQPATPDALRVDRVVLL